MNERELLAHYRPWLRKVAAGMTTPNRAEELAQEGWIAAWKASQTYDGSAPLNYWLKFKAQGRMIDVLRNWRTAPHVPVEAEHAVWEQLHVELPEVEAAYHHGEILAALDRLSPREREYIVARFWGGLNYPELTAHFGYPPQGLWSTSRRKLAVELKHLAVAA